jgi:hypothetical protein
MRPADMEVRPTGMGDAAFRTATGTFDRAIGMSSLDAAMAGDASPFGAAMGGGMKPLGAAMREGSRGSERRGSKRGEGREGEGRRDRHWILLSGLCCYPTHAAGTCSSNV